MAAASAPTPSPRPPLFELPEIVAVIIGSLFPLLAVLAAFFSPSGGVTLLLLAVVPAFIVLPVLALAAGSDPLPARHIAANVLWGATVCVTFAALTNAGGIRLLGDRFDPDVARALTLVVLAPLVEEAAKLSGLFRPGGRRPFHHLHVLVASGATAVGFTVVEDLLYFIDADRNDQLADSFVVRALLTPFAHTLFAFAAAFGYATYRRSGRRRHVLVGYVAAAGLHGLFNSSALDTDAQTRTSWWLLSMAVLFVGGLGALRVTGLRHRDRLVSAATAAGFDTEIVAAIRRPGRLNTWQRELPGPQLRQRLDELERARRLCDPKPDTVPPAGPAAVDPDPLPPPPAPVASAAEDSDR